MLYWRPRRPAVGEPRVTRDIDITLLAGFGSEGAIVEELLAGYRARIGNAADFARRYRVLLLGTGAGIGIDVSLGALPFEEEMVCRASLFSFGPGLELRTCSAEDLVVLKVFASRPLDVRDAEGVVLRNQLDWPYIERQLAPLLEVKPDASIAETLTRLKHLGTSA